MSVDDALATLRAGLDRHEQVAKAAAKRSAEWRVYEGSVRGAPFYEGDPDYGFPAGGETCIVYDEGFPLLAEAQHIALQDPKHVLDQIKAIREIMTKQEEYSSAQYPDFEGGYASALDDVVELLASIYAKNTTDTEKP